MHREAMMPALRAAASVRYPVPGGKDGDAAPATVPTHQQVWFGESGRPWYGWLSLPARGQMRAAVVLCSPMGEEGRSSHRTFRRLAESLAEAGIASLRFDYDGTGDSAGQMTDPDRVRGWLDTVVAARDYLADLGVTEVSAVGMRLGATIAARAAAEHADTGAPLFEHFVLWDPCVSGKAFLRQGEALYGFGEEGRSPQDGLRHTPGFQYTEDTAREMRSLDLSRLAVDAPLLGGRALVLLRDDRPLQPGMGRALDLLEAAVHGAVDRLDALDQADLLETPPSDCVVPERSLADVVTWLSDHSGTERTVVAAPEPDRGVVISRPGRGDVIEQSTLLGAGEGRPGLYGVVSEPVVVPESDGPRPWVVLVNVTVEHHIGPGRQWVELARDWASRGFRVVRLDQSGVGDGPSRVDLSDDINFDESWLDDVPAAVRELGADGSPVAMMGLCSGVYSALEAAVRSEVDAIYGVNLRLTLYEAARGTSAYSKQRRAAIVPPRPIARLAARHRVLAGGIWRLYRQFAFWNAPAAVLWRVARRGTHIEAVANPQDARHFREVLVWLPCMWWLRARGRVRLAASRNVDHAMLARRAQLEVRHRMTRFLLRRYPTRAGHLLPPS
ncbi:serine aminopeptidase domain-containing protein [Nocardioides acrostichi]|uniref:Alpha/beta hydrolase n=1 Tax=Nocardioides acrostichi TaxID=2784339 RepID=A0A930Y5W6_9ACTN|nr:alpha/beta hydrolase [Nocardioides acrostichi]MBF4160311.1 alpha/beta hydrolase [Nocardioides acrostichi]